MRSSSNFGGDCGLFASRSPATRPCSTQGGLTLGRYPERNKVWRNDGLLPMRRTCRRPVIGHRLRAVDCVRLYLLASRSKRLRAEIGAHILPNDLARGRDLEEAA